MSALRTPAPWPPPQPHDLHSVTLRPLTSHCYHWTHDGEQCCDCGHIDTDGSHWAIRDCPGPGDAA